MRPEPMRVILLVLAVLLAAGCATSTDRSDKVQAAGSQSAMSSKGLANLRLAQNYLAAGRMEYALDRANRALRTDPDSADLQVVLGMIRDKLGDKERAAEHYARAAKLGPDSGHVQNVYGVWLCEQGSFDEAEVVFARAVKDPFYKSREQAHFNAGKCAMRAGKLDLAGQHLRQGLTLAPEDPALLGRMAELQFLRQDYLSARAFYQRHEALGVASPEMLSLAASIEQGAGNTVAAQGYRQRLHEQFPDYTPPATEGSRQP